MTKCYYEWVECTPFMYKKWRFAFGYPFAGSCIIIGWKNVFWRIWWRL
jgi:hypothetical protein